MVSVAATKEASITKAKTPNTARLISLFIAFLGCTVTALPFLFEMTSPAPLVLLGSGIAVVALALFLFFSL